MKNFYLILKCINLSCILNNKQEEIEINSLVRLRGLDDDLFPCHECGWSMQKKYCQRIKAINYGYRDIDIAKEDIEKYFNKELQNQNYSR